ncbi:MAG: hypothetical protein AAGD07_20370 [Planctomycetota bacterium]
MPARLTVLLIRPAAVEMRDAYDDVIANSLGRPGLDLVLIEQMPGPTSPETERLALEGLPGTIATVAWCEAETMIASLNEGAASGLHARRYVRRSHAADRLAGIWQPQADSVGVFHFDMRLQAVGSLQAQLAGLLVSQKTQTFGIALPMQGASRMSPAASFPGTVAASTTANKSTSQAKPPSIRKSDQHDQLDQWVDDLDELEL